MLCNDTLTRTVLIERLKALRLVLFHYMTSIPVGDAAAMPIDVRIALKASAEAGAAIRNALQDGES